MTGDRIPIIRAEELAKAHGYDQVIIYARRVGEPGQEWITTYGRDKTHCAAAAKIGDAIGRQVVVPLEELTARAEKAETRAAELQDDKDRLDFLDRCNGALNDHYGTKYGWQLVLSHNVTRLMLGRMVVDLHDSHGGHGKLPSCRVAIDVQRQRFQAPPGEQPTPPDDGSLHLQLAFQAFYGAGGTDEDPCRALKVSRIQTAIRDAMEVA